MFSPCIQHSIFSAAMESSLMFRLSSILIVATAVALTGCVASRTVSVAGHDGLARVNERGERETAYLTLKEGEGRPVQSLHIAPDLTTWMDKSSGAMRSAPTDDVVSVSFRKHASGAATGAISGVFVGVVAGAALGAITYRPPDRSTDEAFPCLLAACSRSEGAAIGMRTGGLLGLLGGSLIGAVRGNRVTYQVQPDSLAGAAREMMKTDPAGFSVVTPRRSPSIGGAPALE